MKYFKILLLFILLGTYTIKANNDGLNTHAFIVNRGQLADNKGYAHPEILFYSQIPGAIIYFKTNSIEYHFFSFKDKTEDELTEDQKREWAQGNKGSVLPKMYKYRVDLEFLNTLKNATVIPSKATEVKRNFYLAHCPDGIMYVNEYQEIIYKNIYKNIDLKFYFEKGYLKYDFIVQP